MPINNEKISITDFLWRDFFPLCDKGSIFIKVCDAKSATRPAKILVCKSEARLNTTKNDKTAGMTIDAVLLTVEFLESMSGKTDAMKNASSKEAYCGALASRIRKTADRASITCW